MDRHIPNAVGARCHFASAALRDDQRLPKADLRCLDVDLDCDRAGDYDEQYVAFLVDVLRRALARTPDE
jgi:hypothetical protein